MNYIVPTLIVNGKPAKGKWYGDQCRQSLPPHWTRKRLDAYLIEKGFNPTDYTKWSDHMVTLPDGTKVGMRIVRLDEGVQG